MLFDLHPKETPESLYGRDNDLKDILTHLRNRRWICLLGPRMVGKTSLVKAAQTKLNKSHINSIYINLWTVDSLRGLLDGILTALSESKGLFSKVKKELSHISALTIGPVGISVKEGAKPVSLSWQILSAIGKHAKKLVIILDEMQELSSVSAHIHKLLANVHSTFPDISFCFTGSQSGLIKALLSPGPDSPLYGRSPVAMNISPFDTETAREFLINGFREHRRKIGADEIEKVLERFGGIPGWLTLYGNCVVVSRMSHRNALQKCERETSKTTRQTLEHYLEGRNREQHLLAMRAIALRSSWSQIRQAIETNTGKQLNDARIKKIIDALSDTFIIQKQGSTYEVIDPVIRRFLLSGKMK